MWIVLINNSVICTVRVNCMFATTCIVYLIFSQYCFVRVSEQPRMQSKQCDL